MAGDSVLILANGEWGSTSRLSGLAAHVACVIAADGAWAKAHASGLHVDCVIGDLDSLTSEQRTALLDSHVETQIHSPNKDFTDLELAVEHALSLAPTKLIIFGALGGRLDHTLANVLLLERAIERGVEVELITGDETAWIIREGFTLPLGQPGDRVSLISLSDESVVRTDGLHYALDDEPLVRDSARGVSNVIVALPVQIAVRSGTLLVVHGPPQQESVR